MLQCHPVDDPGIGKVADSGIKKIDQYAITAACLHQITPGKTMVLLKAHTEHCFASLIISVQEISQVIL